MLKQLRAAAERGDADGLLAMTQEAIQSSGGRQPEGATLQTVLVVLIKHGRVGEATRLLEVRFVRMMWHYISIKDLVSEPLLQSLSRATRLLESQRDALGPPVAGSPRPLATVGFVAAIAAMPQCAGVTPAVGAALVDAVASLTEIGEGGVEATGGLVTAAESREYLRRRARWASIEVGHCVCVCGRTDGRIRVSGSSRQHTTGVCSVAPRRSRTKDIRRASSSCAHVGRRRPRTLLVLLLVLPPPPPPRSV